MRLIGLLLAGHREKLFIAAHGLSQGGLSAGLTEMVLRHSVGADITLENVGVALLSESPGRVVVAIDQSKNEVLIKLSKQYAITLTKIGKTGGDSLTINGCVIQLDELRTAQTSTFPELFG